MNKILSAALAVSLVASAGTASAAPYDNHRDHRVEQLHRQAHKAERKADRAERRADRAQARYVRAATRRYNGGRYVRPAGYQARAWRHGDRLPYSYRTRIYVVDHHRYGLMAPPRGYQYVRVNNDVALTAVTTGIIASVITGLFN